MRNTAAKAREQAAARQAARLNGQQQADQQHGKRPGDAGQAGAAAEPAAKQQRLERPGRLDGASAAMVVGMQVGGTQCSGWLTGGHQHAVYSVMHQPHLLMCAGDFVLHVVADSVAGPAKNVCEVYMRYTLGQ